MGVRSNTNNILVLHVKRLDVAAQQVYLEFILDTVVIGRCLSAVGEAVRIQPKISDDVTNMHKHDDDFSAFLFFESAGQERMEELPIAITLPFAPLS